MRIGELVLSMVLINIMLSIDVQAAGTMNYQGRLLDSLGQPVNGSVAMAFYIYDDVVEGSVLWVEERTVDVDDGMFSVELGTFAPIPDSAFLYSFGNRFLQVEVNDESIGPRTSLASVPRAFVSRGIQGDVQTQPGFLRVALPESGSSIDLSGQDQVISFMVFGDTTLRISPGEIELTFAQCDGASRPATVTQSRITSCGFNVGDSTGGTQASVSTDGLVVTSPGVALAGQVDVALTRAGLTIADGAAPGYVLTSDAAGNGTWQPSSGGSNGWVDEGAAVRLETETDKVGIGVSTPTDKLEVDGNARIYNEVIGGKARFGPSVSNTGIDAFSAGNSNDAFGDYSTIGGGRAHEVHNQYGTISGGFQCEVAGDYGFVGGGQVCQASGTAATVAGGWLNTASGFYSAVLGGAFNQATGMYGAVCGGSQHINQGQYSTVIGGNGDTLSDEANYSAAFGQGVVIWEDHTVVFFDSLASGRIGINRDSKSGVDYPVHVGTNTSNGNGAHLTAGGTWTNGSSRTFKENFQSLDSRKLLTRISELPVEAWNYRGTDERHIGPVAEDFVAAFDVGTVREDNTRDDKYLSPGDVAGVALAGVKEIIRENEELRKLVVDLKERVEELEKKK
jgi:hypothetical protein